MTKSTTDASSVNKIPHVVEGDSQWLMLHQHNQPFNATVVHTFSPFPDNHDLIVNKLW